MSVNLSKLNAHEKRRLGENEKYKSVVKILPKTNSNSSSSSSVNIAIAKKVDTKGTFDKRKFQKEEEDDDNDDDDDDDDDGDDYDGKNRYNKGSKAIKKVKVSEPPRDFKGGPVSRDSVTSSSSNTLQLPKRTDSDADKRAKEAELNALLLESDIQAVKSTTMFKDKWVSMGESDIAKWFKGGWLEGTASMN